MAATVDLQPSVLKRAAPRIEQIKNAPDIEAVLDLAPTAIGLADPVWLRRTHKFGPSAAGAIADRLNGDWMCIHAKDRTQIQERFIGALRWCGEEGVDALLTCWDSLDDHGRSLACVALGLLGAPRSGDYIWSFHQKLKNSSRENLFVGALWGLIDLQDHRAADALAGFLDKDREFYEMYGFISRAGDKRFILPLIYQIVLGPDTAKEEAMWALTGMAHRIGRGALAEELRNTDEPEKSTESDVESFVGKVFKYSAEDVESHFEVFYNTDGSNLPRLSGKK